MPAWSTHLRIFIFTALLSILLLYLFILLVDPYDNVPFSLPLEREPISTNQRFAYPSLARKPEFDSAIIGTSTARLFKPERLNELTGDSWVNLAMNSATAYEQMEMLKLFLRHHPDAKHIVIGIDDAWCRPGKEIQKFTFRPFPPWMYDENRWNDLLYLINDKALENAVRLIEYWSGKREAKYNKNGYRDFTEDFGEYEVVTARSRIYANVEKGANEVAFRNIDPYPIADALPKVYAAHSMLEKESIGTPEWTTVTVFFMPLHGHYLMRGINNYRSCKSSLLAKLSDWSNVRIIDWMHVNALTLNDENYWDPLHFTNAIAKKLENTVAEGTLRSNR